MIKSKRSFERAKAMERNKKRYTIYDVAKQASVSPSTVSHVLNGTASISEETQKRIRAAIRELNYRPNANARALRQLHSHILGVTFPDIASEYYAACTASIIQHAQRHKYVVLASDLHFDNNVLAASIPALGSRTLAMPAQMLRCSATMPMIQGIRIAPLLATGSMIPILVTLLIRPALATAVGFIPAMDAAKANSSTIAST